MWSLYQRVFTWNTGTLCALILLAACGGGGTEPKVPSNITVDPTSVSFTAIGQTQQLSPTVTDQQGNPLTNASVTWSSSDVAVATVSGTGLVTAHGSGTAEITAKAGSATAQVEVQVVSFDIQVRYLSSATPSQRQAFADAQARWESLITGDVEDLQLTAPAQACGSNSPAINEQVDDLLILVTLDSIDGPGNVLGSAGPCYIRDDNNLTVLGAMTFDTTDLEDVEAAGLLQTLILHEMGHVLGFGSLWPTQGLLADPSLPPDNGTDPHFTGLQAIAAFDDVGGGGYSGAKVPVEDTGGEGTADGHWRESVFVNELMTGFVDPGQNPLSVVTVASLGDQGYTVNLAGADAYSLPLTTFAFRAKPRFRLGNDVLRLPIKKVDRRGRVVGLFRR
jgi:Bacterial Ig-like domain (group 2)/Leishmanolysin